MTKYEVLNKLSNNEIDYKTAYHLLYPKIKIKKARKARFIKLRIKIPDHKGASFFINLLFLIPIPIGIIKFFLKRKMDKPFNEHIPISTKELIEIASSKGTFIEVLASDHTKVMIKTI